MFCSKCGTQNDDNNLKCSKCGNIFQQMPQSTISTKRKKIVRIVLVTIGVMLFLMAILIFASIFIVPITSYRDRSYDSAAQDTLRKASTTQEAFFIDNTSFADSLVKLVGANYGLSINEGVTLQIISAGKDQYHMIAFHEKGSKKYHLIGPGGIIEEYQE